MMTRRRLIPGVFHVKHPAVFFLLLMGFWLAGCVVSKNPVTGRKRAYGWTWQQEQQIGKEADQQIIAQYGIYDDPKLTAYVNRVAERVLAESHVRRPDADPEFKNTPFTFRVLDSPVVNAFALPGGYVYITRGLVSYLENEAQLAMVLGHEIAHVEARHASQRAFEQQMGQIGLLGGAILGQEALGIPAQDLLNIAGTATQLLFLKYGRDDEREADKLGVEYGAMAGYQAGEGASFFNTLKRIQEKQGNAIPGFLSTHPDPGEREAKILSMAQEWAAKTNMTDLNRDALYQAIDGIILGENPRNGFVRNSVFYHPELRFQFPVPRGYQLINQAQQVVMVEQNQQAIMVFTLAKEQSAQAAAAAFGNQQGVKVIENGRVQGSRYPAYFILADAQTQQGQVLRLISYHIEYGGRVYTFLAYTSQQLFANMQDQFLQTMRGFDQVSDPSILNIQPARIRITSANRSAPFRTFVQGNELPMDFQPVDMAILNQVDLDTQIAPGAKLKLSTR